MTRELPEKTSHAHLVFKFYSNEGVIGYYQSLEIAFEVIFVRVIVKNIRNPVIL